MGDQDNVAKNNSSLHDDTPAGHSTLVNELDMDESSIERGLPVNEDDGVETIVKIQHKNHPVETLTLETLENIQDQLEDMEDATDPSYFIKFKNVKILQRLGLMELTCRNTITLWWFKENFPLLKTSQPIHGEIVKKDVPMVKLSIKLRNRTISDKQFFKRVVQKNPGIVTKDWKVLNSAKLNDGYMLLFLLVPVASADILRDDYGFKINYTGGVKEFKVVEGGDRRVKEEPIGKTYGYRT